MVSASLDRSLKWDESGRLTSRLGHPAEPFLNIVMPEGGGTSSRARRWANDRCDPQDRIRSRTQKHHAATFKHGNVGRLSFAPDPVAIRRIVAGLRESEVGAEPARCKDSSTR